MGKRVEGRVMRGRAGSRAARGGQRLNWQLGPPSLQPALLLPCIVPKFKPPTSALLPGLARGPTPAHNLCCPALAFTQRVRASRCGFSAQSAKQGMYFVM